MVTDDELRKEYARVFDNIHADDQLKERILKQKSRKRNPKPFIASAATLAAGIMIFAAVQNVTFDRNGNDGVISETVTTVDNTDPESTRSEMNSAVKPGEENVQHNGENAQPANAEANNTGSAKSNAVDSDSTVSDKLPANKTNEQIEKEAAAGAAAAHSKADSVVRQDTSGRSVSNSGSESVGSPIQSPSNSNTYAMESENGSANSDVKVQENASEDSTASGGGIPHAAAYGAMSVRSGASYESGSLNVNELYDIASVRPAALSGLISGNEQWDNNRYFNYIGKDIISSVESVAGFVYTGDDSGYITVDDNGGIQDDIRVFEFSNGTDDMKVMVSTNISMADMYMSDESTAKSDINDNSAVVFSNGSEYICYMVDGTVLYVIDMNTSDTAVLEAVLMSL